MPAEQQRVVAPRAAAVDQKLQQDHYNQKIKQQQHSNGLKTQAEVGSSGTQRIRDKDGCCNPFRIPNHNVRSGLRNVPELIREQLTHVNFGKRICTLCRIRVYKMLKERKVLKPSSRLNNGARNSIVSARKTQSQQLQQKKNEIGTMSGSASSRPGQTTVSVSGAVAKTNKEENSESKTSPRDRPPVPTTARDVVEQMAAIAPDHTSSSNLVDNLNRLSESTMARRTKSQLAMPPDLCPSKQVCCFCNMSEDNEIEYGKFYHHNGIVTHYYCLLLSSNMEQRGSDDQGILGFLAEDIQKEIRRGKRLVCSYCKKSGATLGCCNVKCKRIFHLPCGLKAGSLHQYFGEFRSYCINHRPRQKIDERVKREIEKMSNILCYICYEEVKPLDSNKTLWAPCCKKNAWFHRSCVQQLAMSAGYFFKCPLCNNKREFQTAMLEYGIYIPRQDASWELVPNAFEELLYRHDRCDAKICQCSKGRTYSSSNGKWELILCRTCGSQGVHVLCGQLKWSNPTWDCPECTLILTKKIENPTEDSTSNLTDSSRGRGHVLNITSQENNDSDSDISVGNESLPLSSSLSSIPTSKSKLNETEVKLRPGPKSFKLQQVQKLKKNIDDKNPNNPIIDAGNTKSKPSEEVICLDSDDETPEILCESTMRGSNKMGSHIATFRPFNGAGNTNIFNFTNGGFITNLQLSSIALATPRTITIPIRTAIEEPSPFNIIISNVTSVPEEFFASVPEESKELPEILTSKLETSSSPTLLPESQQKPLLKRPREDGDLEILGLEMKRARLDQDNTIKHQEKLKEVASSSTDISKTTTVGTANNSSVGVLVNSSHINSTTAKVGCSGVSDENCHGYAGGGCTGIDSGPFYSSATGAAQFTTTGDKPKLPVKVSKATFQSSTTAKQLVESLSCSNSESSKSRTSNDNRAGLIPDVVRLSDLKFRIFGDDIEISLGDHKIEVKNKGMPQHMDKKTSDISSDGTVFSSSESQIVSSDKSDSKLLSLCCNGSTMETIHSLRQLRSSNSRNFLYEDDNTLLEYPTMTIDASGNARIVKNFGKQDHNDLKENWNPEVSSSSRNNILENFTINNNNNPSQTSSSDLRDIFNSFNKSNNNHDENNRIARKEDSDTYQRLLRRSSRTIRHFQSIKSINSLTNGDSMKASSMNLISQSTENVNLLSDQAVRNTRSQKVIDSSEIPEQDKHLKNVDINNLRFDLTGKVNMKQENGEINAYKDFKVSIDLQKIKNFMSAKPDLFLKTEHGVKRNVNVCSMDAKLKVELCSGEKKFLTKAQSFDCLLDIAKNDNLQLSRSSWKSLSELSQIANTNSINNNNLKLTDKRDCTAKKSRKSQQRKSKRCVR